MVSWDDSLAGRCLAQFHVGEGVRRDKAPPDAEIKDTPRRAHDRIGPRELRPLVGSGVNFLQFKIKVIDMRRRQLPCLYLADRNAFEFVLAQRF